MSAVAGRVAGGADFERAPAGGRFSLECLSVEHRPKPRASPAAPRRQDEGRHYWVFVLGSGVGVVGAASIVTLVCSVVPGTPPSK